MENSLELVRAIWACWADLLADVWWLGKALAPFAVGYAMLYAVTAALFLMTLRVQSTDGKLSVRKDSLAFFLAHPLSKYYGLGSVKGHQESTFDVAIGKWESVPILRYPNHGNICAFYARLFNMLLFVWPFLGLYLLVVALLGPIIGMLFLSKLVYVDFEEEMFLSTRGVRWFRGRELPLFMPLGLLSIIVLAVVKLSTLLLVGKTIAWFLICAVPVIGVLVLISYSTAKLYQAEQGDGSTASLVKETLMAKKARFCKLLEFK